MYGFLIFDRRQISYYIGIEGNDPCYLIWSVICTHTRNIGTSKEYVNDNAKNAPELEDTELVFLKTSNKPIYEDHRDYSTPEHGVYSGEIGSVDKKAETDPDMDIIDDDDPKYSGEVEIHKMMDITKDIISYGDLYNQSNQKL